MVSDNENDQTVTNQAFEVLRFIAGKRLALGRITVIDATNVQPEARKPLVELARQYHCLPVAIVLDLPEKLCRERNSQRADRDFGPHVVRNQKSQLRRSLRGLHREGFRHVFVLNSPSVSSPSASRGWSGSCVETRYGGSTSASSAFLPWRASRWIRGCSRPLETSQVHFEMPRSDSRKFHFQRFRVPRTGMATLLGTGPPLPAFSAPGTWRRRHERPASEVPWRRRHHGGSRSP